MEEKGLSSIEKDRALGAVPLSERQHWLTPAMIFGGLEFTIPVLMIGSTLAGSYGLAQIFFILLIGLVIIQWIGNAIGGYIGAKTGRASSVIARTGFGATQAKVIVALSIFVISLGWWATQTAVAGNAISVMLGVDYTTQWLPWAVITAVAGLLFAIPSIIGYSSMKWTDYIAVPAGLLLVIASIVLALKNIGWDTIVSWSPEPSMTFLAAISLVIGANVSQWVISADYTRYAKPKVKDNVLIPLGIVAVGFPLFYIGAIMSVGVGNADIVQVMVGLGFPVWGFLILWLATWTSQLVNNYTMGLALANLLNVDTGRGRAMLTFIATLVAIVVALAGILDYFTNFLYMSAIIYPAIAGVIFADFFFVRNQQWEDKPGWNWMATIAFFVGIAFGYYTQYVNPMGLPAVQSLLATGISYYLCMRIKAKVAPDSFTPAHWTEGKEIKPELTESL